MHQYIRLILCLIAIIVHNVAYATKLSRKEYERFSGGTLQADSNELLLVRDGGGNFYLSVLTDRTQAPPTDTTNSNTVRGLLRSNKGSIVHYITEIPCNIIATLESDAGEAESFVNQIEAGQVPTIISNLPQDAVDVFSDVLNVLTLIPSEIINVAEAAATDVVNIVDEIEDGSITSVLAALPSEVVADITNAWGDLTDGITNAWNGFTCLFENCPSTDTCGAAQTGAATTTAGYTPATTTNNAPAAYSATQSSSPTFTQSTGPNSTQPSLASRSAEWVVGSFLGIAVVGILGVAVLL